MKAWTIKVICIVIYIVGSVAAIATLSFTNHSRRVQCADLKQRTEEQSLVIDSLLKRRDKFIDVQLHVTDKSRFAIYGRYNKGTINVPNERTYLLEIDSTSVNMK